MLAVENMKKKNDLDLELMEIISIYIIVIDVGMGGDIRKGGPAIQNQTC